LIVKVGCTFPRAKEGRIQLIRYLDEIPQPDNERVGRHPSQSARRPPKRLGYPTQKPLALLERINQASSNPGDVVLDPFCGCGTTVCASQKLGRAWIGNRHHPPGHRADARAAGRLFGGQAQYEVVGQPADVASAEALARQDRHQFEWWALSLIKARPAQDKKKGSRPRAGRRALVHRRSAQTRQASRGASEERACARPASCATWPTW
jgi:hypothetical protein